MTSSGVWCASQRIQQIATMPYYQRLSTRLLDCCDNFCMGTCLPSKMHRHDDVIKWKHFPRYWPFVRGIHRSSVNSPHKGQWRGALMFSLICAWINVWANNRAAGDFRCHNVHYDVIAMIIQLFEYVDPQGQGWSLLKYVRYFRMVRRNVWSVYGIISTY